MDHCAVYFNSSTNHKAVHTMFAHYYGSKAKGFTVTISHGIVAGTGDKQFKVTGKREAHKVAKLNNAAPWNF